MSHLFDDLPDRQPPQRTWSGIVAATVTDFATLLSVKIPTLDPNVVWKGCRWQARNNIDFPQKDDPCLVIFDDEMQLWVVAWWPF